MTEKDRVAVVGLIVLLLFVGLIVLAGITHNLAGRADSEAVTLQNLKVIAAIEVQYFNTHKRTFGTLEQLCVGAGLSAKFAGNPAVVDRYVFTLTVSRKRDGASWFKITADPQDETSVANHFYLDSDDPRIRVNRDRQAGPTDPEM